MEIASPFKLTVQAIHPFMEAIRANPKDNLPRLIYADYLEENGEGEYAEYIRRSIQPVSPLSMEKWTLEEHKAALIGRVRDANTVPEIHPRLVALAKKASSYFQGRVVWERGFIQKITVSLAEYPAVHALYPFCALTAIHIPYPFHFPYSAITANTPDHAGKWCVCPRVIPVDLWEEHRDELNTIVATFPNPSTKKACTLQRKQMDRKLSTVLLKHAWNVYRRSLSLPV